MGFHSRNVEIGWVKKDIQNYLSFKSKLTELSPWHRTGILLLVLISVLNGLPQRKTVFSNSTYRYARQRMHHLIWISDAFQQTPNANTCKFSRAWVPDPMVFNFLFRNSKSLKWATGASSKSIGIEKLEQAAAVTEGSPNPDSTIRV